MPEENQHHSSDVVAWGHLRFNLLLPSSLVTPFSPLWGSSRRPFPNPTHSHTHTQMPLAAAPVVYGNHTLAFKFMPCQIARIPVSHSLRHYLRKGQQLLLSRASLNFSAWLGARWLRCHGARTKTVWNRVGAPLLPKRAALCLILQLLYQKVEFHLFPRPRVAVSRCFFFLFMESQMFLFVIPLLCLLHPPLGLSQTAASLNQLARTCMRRAAEGVSPTRLCALSRLTTVFRGLHGRVDSAAPLVLSNGPASGFFMKTPFNNV